MVKPAYAACGYQTATMARALTPSTQAATIGSTHLSRIALDPTKPPTYRRPRQY